VNLQSSGGDDTSALVASETTTTQAARDVRNTLNAIKNARGQTRTD
jgi:hypothetical protein